MDPENVLCLTFFQCHTASCGFLMSNVAISTVFISVPTFVCKGLCPVSDINPAALSVCLTAGEAEEEVLLLL